MAKKKSAKKQSAAKKPQKKSALKKSTATKGAPRLPGLAAMRNGGATAIEVQFHGFSDDGWFEYRVIGGGGKIEMSATATIQIGAFLQEHFDPYGEGIGSVLLARFDLVQSVCRGYGGDGDPPTRLAELVSVLEAHGVKKLVGELRSGKFSKCKSEPTTAMPKKVASDLVSRLLDRVREYLVECGEYYDEEIGYDGKEYALLDAGKSTFLIDVPKRRVTLKHSSPKKTLVIPVESLRETSFPVRFS